MNKLTAAAPEMYEALTNAKTALALAAAFMQEGTPSEAQLREAQKLVNAALAKADNALLS